MGSEAFLCAVLTGIDFLQNVKDSFRRAKTREAALGGFP